MIPVIGICGASNSGKTTLAEGVIAELGARGIKVGAIKHHGHAGHLVQPAEAREKDSARLAAAGARRVALAHADGVWLDAPGLAGTGPRGLAARLMAGMEMVVVEGFKTAAIPKIEVVAPDADPVLPPGGELLALARRGGSGQEAGLTVLDADNPAAVCDFILERVRPSSRPDEPAKVFIDGQELPINSFVQQMISGMLRGFVASLKGGDAAGKIEVRLG